MADERRAQLTLGIKTEGASTASSELERIAKDYAAIAQQTGSVGSALRLATAEANKFGATDEDVRRLNKLYNDYRKTLQQVESEIEDIVEDQKKVVETAPAAPKSGGSGAQERLTRIGSELRSLPSTQLPGVPISTDQIAGLIRLSGALTGISEKASTATKIGSALAPVLGSVGAGFVSMLVAAAPVVAVFGGFILAITELQKRTAEASEALQRQFDAQDSIDEFVRSGATTEEALKRRTELEKTIADATDRTNQAEEEQAQDFAKRSQLIGGQFTSRLQDLTNINSQQAKYNERIKETKDTTADAEAEIAELNAQLEAGEFAANDAAEAEKRLAEERSKTALASADSAAKELQAEQRALNATEEQNLKRLDTIEDEKAVLERQIEVLESSGVASEEVTAKIAALKESLGLLGKETEFINSTALEASRAADAEKKAKKDAEEAAKKAEQAQDQYTKSVQSAQTTFRQSVQDIGTRFTQTLQDNELKFNRDLTDIATKYRRDEFDLTIKAQRAERDALQGQIDDLGKMRRDAFKDEQQAIQDGDFKALFLARQNAAEALTEQEKELDLSRQKREQADRDAREDLLRNAQRTRQDRMLANERQLVDQRTAQSRELAQAQLTRQRALQAASEALNAELGIRQQFWNATLKQAQTALNQIQGAVGGANPQARAAQMQAFSFGGLKRVIQR